jgi:hypothetical protein
MIYEIENLKSARHFLANSANQVTLSNPQGSTRYYGMRVIDYMFNVLKNEFPDKVEGFIVNAFDDYSAMITAKELGYNQVSYVIP